MKQTLFTSAITGLALAAKYPEPAKADISNIDVRGFPAADLQSLYQSTGNAKQTNRNVFHILENAERTADLTATRSIDSLFLRLPSSAELDELILSADSVAILKTIQTVATDDSIPCDKRIAYLLEVLGRIRSAIEKKQFAADQLKVIIDGAKTEIARLNKEIDRLRQNITDLWLDELHEQLADAIARLEDVYSQFNHVEAQIAPNEAKVAGYEKEITLLTRNADEERNRIANDRLKLTEVESKIRDLERQLIDAKNRKSALENSIKKS